jgi:hypothetical protein
VPCDFYGGPVLIALAIVAISVGLIMAAVRLVIAALPIIRKQREEVFVESEN